MTRKRARPSTEPLLVVSPGCPAGVGPEVAVRAATELAESHAVVLFGDRATLDAALERAGRGTPEPVPFRGGRPPRGRFGFLEVIPPLPDADRRAPTRGAGAAQLTVLARAAGFVRAHRNAALVTGPISKEAVARSGLPGAARFRGHTEWLERFDGSGPTTMCFVAPGAATSLVTTHLALSRVPRSVTSEGVVRATVALGELLRAIRPRRLLRLAVAALNPHAGEGGLLGSEEARVIAPAMECARPLLPTGVALEGPVGAETAYRRLGRGDVHGVVAMYHDQATIPMKLLAFGEAVNVTWGLSFVRTSVDHGTAYDVAWRGVVSADGMVSALRLGHALVRARRIALARRRAERGR